jgi:GST-like protein
VIEKKPVPEKRLDDALASTFPASDPVSFTTTTIPATDHDTEAKAPPKKRAKSKTHTLYAAKQGGSMIVETAFAFAKLPIEIIDVPWTDTGWNSKRLKELNPLGQVPTLVLPDGTVMTESVAIILHLADKVRGFKLVPPPTHKNRAAFLRWLVFMVAAIYPTYTYGDVPERWVGENEKQGAGKALRTGTDDHRKTLWRYVESQIEGPWFLGKTMTALDVYVWVMSHWRPGRDWFEKECPKLHHITTAMKAHPIAKKVAARNKS